MEPFLCQEALLGQLVLGGKRGQDSKQEPPQNEVGGWCEETGTEFVLRALRLLGWDLLYVIHLIKIQAPHLISLILRFYSVIPIYLL